MVSMRRPTLILTFLWLATIGTLGWFFYFGRTEKAADGRTAIVLTTAERQFVLTEMRLLLGAVSQIHSALGNNDLAAAEKASRSVGMQMVNDLAGAEKTILLKLPKSFKTLGLSTHVAFDDFAKSIAARKPHDQLFRELGTLTNKCVACHAGYSLK